MSDPSISRSAEQSTLAPLMRGVIRNFLDPNQGAWDWERAGNGGYLGRMVIDVDGDGVPEYFYSTTLTNQNSVLQWWVFKRTGPQRLSQYANDLLASSLWQGGESPGIGLDTVSMPGREARRGQTPEEWTANLIRFSFRFPHIEPQVSEVSDDDANRVYQENIANHPKVEVILLSDFLDGKGEWRELAKWRKSPDFRLYREDDWEAACQNKGFTAATELAATELAATELAATELAAIEKTEKSSARQPATETKAAAHSGSEIQPVENGPASKPSDIPGSAGVIILAVIAAAIVGLAAFLLRKRKAA